LASSAGEVVTREHLTRISAELARLERETGELSSLVQQLLLLAGLEAGARPVEILVPVSMQSLCESII